MGPKNRLASSKVYETKIVPMNDREFQEGKADALIKPLNDEGWYWVDHLHVGAAHNFVIFQRDREVE